MGLNSICREEMKQWRGEKNEAESDVLKGRKEGKERKENERTDES